MPDRITQIKNLLVGLKENSVAELRDDTDKVVERIETLLEGCSDDSQVIIAYDRSQLDAYIWANTNKEYTCSDEEWKKAWDIIMDDSTAWTAMSDACYEAECNLYDKLEDEGRLPS